METKKKNNLVQELEDVRNKIRQMLKPVGENEGISLNLKQTEDVFKLIDFEAELLDKFLKEK